LIDVNIEEVIMAKKNNRPKAKPAAKPVPNEPAAPQIIEETAPLPAESAPRVPRAPKLSRSQAAAERIEDEYAYITGDLRRVLLLAAAIFALLIVLNIVLGQAGG
jgi:hypothetical protein